MQIRRWINTLTVSALFALAWAAGCRSEAERRLAGSVRRELERGDEAAKNWIAKAADSTESAIATGYLERLRLGLGSPFRLIDLALHDPRLTDDTRNRLAWSLLERVREGRSYDIDARVLDRAGTARAVVTPGAGRAHLALIKRTLAESDSVRAAELGLRLGYTMAAAEKLVSAEAPQLAGTVTALLTDRILAERDVQRLLQIASQEHTDPLDLLSAWRNTRLFSVEAPRSAPVTSEIEVEAIRIAQDVLGELRRWGLEVSAHGLPDDDDADRGKSLLTPGARVRLSAAAAEIDMPPETPVVIAARQLSREVPQARELSDDERRLRLNFATAATTEEAFVVEHARLQETSELDAAPARAILQAAVALRAYAQERIWYPGMPAPATAELQERYGLGAITFDREIPAHWRPYYRRMLGTALEDLYRVMPALRITGLRIHFGPTPPDADALAIHDPRERELLLPPATAAGTLAHELAHDVDWQMSVRRYHVRGDYATDRSTLNSDGLSAQVRSLASASLPYPTAEARITAHARRPAEIFARGVDWYVAVSLAQEGRRDGYLSSVQDELITGYGTVRPPDVSGAAGDALMSILADLAPVYREQRDAFRALYGKSRAPRAYDLVRIVTETQAPALPTFVGELQALETRRSAALDAVNGAVCGLAEVGSELRLARRELVQAAATASARGIALRYSSAWLGSRGRDLMLREFYGGPLGAEKADAVTMEYVSEIAAEVRDMLQMKNTNASPFELFQGTRCAKAAALF